MVQRWRPHTSTASAQKGWSLRDKGVKNIWVQLEFSCCSLYHSHHTFTASASLPHEMHQCCTGSGRRGTRALYTNHPHLENTETLSEHVTHAQCLPEKRNRSWQAKSVSLHGRRCWSLLLRGGHQGTGFPGYPRREVALARICHRQHPHYSMCLDKGDCMSLPPKTQLLPCLDQVKLTQEKGKKLKTDKRKKVAEIYLKDTSINDIPEESLN